MNKRALRERIRRKRRRRMIRKLTRLSVYAVAAILLVVFLVRGVIFPIINSIGGDASSGDRVEVQAETPAADPNAAVRQPLRGQGDIAKTTQLTPGWHEDENGRWYQNADGTYYSSGFQEIDGVLYSFDENGYMQTGWVSKGVKDFYFNEDGSYNPDKVKPRIALTFDDGPGQYTDKLLDCVEQYNAHVTFFMLGSNVSEYKDTVKRMVDLGCEIGSHSWDHPDLQTISLEEVAKQFSDTDNALIDACGQAATAARAPYGSGNQDIYNTVQKPFFMWSMDTLDWKVLNADTDYETVMNGDLTDGSIILMHDIHEPSVEAAIRIIPALIEKGYKLVTVSELAEAKDVELQYASYSNFWDSQLSAGAIPGYKGNTETEDTSGDASSEEEGFSDGSEGTEESLSDGTEETGFSDGSQDESGDSQEECGTDSGEECSTGE